MLGCETLGPNAQNYVKLRRETVHVLSCFSIVDSGLGFWYTNDSSLEPCFMLDLVLFTPLTVLNISVVCKCICMTYFLFIAGAHSYCLVGLADLPGLRQGASTKKVGRTSML